MASRSHLKIDSLRASLLPGVLLAVASLGLTGLSSPIRAASASPATSSPAVIGCFHQKIHRYTAEPRPERCVFAGLRGEDSKFSTVVMKRMKWSKWGQGAARASRGVVAGTGEKLRLIAYDAVLCRDGRRWYTTVNFTNEANGRIFVLRHLPECNSADLDLSPGR